MNNTIMVSFPRSGHTIVAIMLMEYFGNEFKHIDTHENGNIAPSLLKNVNCHKTHDFNLNVSSSLPIQYAIQFRTPLESIVSWYKLNLEKRIISPNDDSKERFESFATAKLEYWINFTRKWIIQPPRDHIFLFKYDNFIKKPLHELKRYIVEVYGENFNEERISKIIENKNVRKINNINQFTHYSKPFFKSLEEKASKEIELSNLPSYFL